MREAWKAFSLGFKKRDVFGLAKQRTGQQMFMFCNLALVSVGFAIINNPPTDLVVDAVTSLALVSATSGAVSSVAMTANGTGYTGLPAVAFSGGGGSGAAGTAVLVATSVASVTVTAAGTGFTTTPTANIVGGGGSGATAVVVVASGSVTAINVVNTGTGYTSPPTVIISGGGGSGATGTVVLAGTQVAGVVLSSAGTGYTSAPTVAFTGGGGSAAAGTASIVKATSDLAISYLPSVIPASYEAMELWMTPAYSPGKTFVKSLYRYCALLEQPDISPQDVSGAWESVFGSLPAVTPYKISARARIVNSLNGSRSEWATGTLYQT